MNPKDEPVTVKQLSDEELAAEAQAGSRHCFEQLVYRYTRRLFYYLRPKMSTDQDTEDIIQETFIRTYRHISRYDTRYKFSTWLYTVAARLVISYYRKKRIREIVFLTADPVPETRELQDPSGTQNPHERLEQEEDAKTIWTLARSLQPDQYQALWLRYIEDLSLKEIAGVMKKTQVHIRVLLHRARLNLVKQINPAALRRFSKEAAPARVRVSFW